MKTSKTISAILFIVSLLSFTSCSLPDSTSRNTPPEGKIAFLRDSQIFTMNPDGSGITQITHDITVASINYAWSPDGQKFAFSGIQNEDVEIYVVNLDGSEQAKLTKSMHPSTSPTWSPDGTQIAFLSSYENDRGQSDIYVIGADGTGQYRLTRSSGLYGDLSWSPNGSQIAYTNEGDIFITNIDGTNNINRTKTPQGEAHPVWSPDGTKILFLSYIAGGTYLEVMDANGSNRKKLTVDSHVGENSFSWSQDGKNIVYISGDTVFVVSSDGDIPRNISNTPNEKMCMFPSWSPDSNWVSFSCVYIYPVDPSGNQQIFIVRANGENLISITSQKENSGHPIWSP